MEEKCVLHICKDFRYVLIETFNTKEEAMNFYKTIEYKYPVGEYDIYYIRKVVKPSYKL